MSPYRQSLEWDGSRVGFGTVVTMIVTLLYYDLRGGFSVAFGRQLLQWGPSLVGYVCLVFWGTPVVGSCSLSWCCCFSFVA